MTEESCKCGEECCGEKTRGILAGMSDKSIGVILLCLQKAIIEGIDITGLFRELIFQLDPDGKLEVINPPNDLNINCPKEWLEENDKAN